MKFKYALTILAVFFYFNIVNAQTVTITSSASGAVCAGTNLVFTASTSGISSPSYQWFKNGTVITGANSSTYSTTTLSNNDQINVWVNGGINNSNIVSNGLKLNLDASNPSSYLGTGNTWYDLSGNNNHATLNNTPTYDASSGSIVTNGTNQYLSIPLFNNSITNITMQVWVYINTNSKGVFIANGYGNGYNIGIGSSGFDASGNSASMLFSGVRWMFNTTTYTAGWHLVTMVLNESSTPFMYIDNALKGSAAGYPGTVPSTPSGYLTLGAIPGDNGRYYAGKFAAAYFYDRALSLTEITQNYNAFSTKTTAYNSNTITVNISGTMPNLSVIGDACVNKTTLSTTSGLSSYTWYKDNVAISGATSNTYTPSASGVYQVTVSNGTCSSTSTAATISNCSVAADGSMKSISNASLIISPEGGANFGTGRDINGKLFSVTGLTTISGTIGSTTAIIGGIISPTNSVTNSIGVIYSTDINFGTYSSTTIQSNAAAGIYSSTITGLTSSTNYFAKSFIVNNAGISYGAVISFTTSSPPISMNSNSAVSNIGPYSASISGSIASAGGSSILASGICYSFSNQTPTVNDSKTTDGTSLGNYVSSLTGLTQGTTYYARAYATNSQGTEYGNQVSFTTLGTVTSPYTAKVWMDRNLGATQAATGVNDAASYGDLYQWGRANDGGQLRTAPNTPTQLATYTTQSTYYITTQPWTSDANWNTKTGSVWNQQPWNNTDGGVNNPCPSGFRVPTTSEWTAELNGMINAGLVTNSNTATNIASGAFSSFLKIPQAGVIENRNTTLITTKTVFWTTDRLDSYSANEIRFWPTQGAYQNANWYSFRYSVRCIAK